LGGESAGQGPTLVVTQEDFALRDCLLFGVSDFLESMAIVGQQEQTSSNQAMLERMECNFFKVILLFLHE
jgi:hypothetical protein